MAAPTLSAHFANRRPSDIRMAQIRHAERTDGVAAVNVAIGNVSLPMHPAMIRRLHDLGGAQSPFRDGVVKYSATRGTAECNAAFMNVIAASGFPVDGLHSLVAEGGSQAMEIMIIGLCGPAGSRERPLLLIDAAYTNYKSMADRLGRATVSIQRRLGADGKFALPDAAEIERVIATHKPGAMVVIPYDNPTGHFYDQAALEDLARLCVKHDVWMVSDEAYRELVYTGDRPTSIWGVTDAQVPGIEGRRISIETASKVWNACGLRIGAMVTDNPEYNQRAIAESTASLCSNVIGQHVFAALGDESHADLQAWFAKQREYYRGMLQAFTEGMRAALPGVIVSSPDASIYSVIDVRDIAKPGFDARKFVEFCAGSGSVSVGGETLTLLTAPMAGFYSVPAGDPNPGDTQMRVAYVETPERMKLVPGLFAELFGQYEKKR